MSMNVFVTFTVKEQKNNIQSLIHPNYNQREGKERNKIQQLKSI